MAPDRRAELDAPRRPVVRELETAYGRADAIRRNLQPCFDEPVFGELEPRPDLASTRSSPTSTPSKSNSG